MLFRILLKYSIPALLAVFITREAHRFYSSDYFIVSSVDREGCDYIPEMDEVLGQHIWFLNINSLKDSILSDKSVETVDIKKIYPGSLLIKCTKREPRFVVKQGKHKMFSDAQGFLFDGYNSDLLQIEVTNFKEDITLFFVDRPYLTEVTYRAKYVNKEDIELILRDGKKVLIDDSINTSIFEEGMRLISKLKEQNVVFQAVDLRYGLSHIIVR